MDMVVRTQEANVHSTSLLDDGIPEERTYAAVKDKEKPGSQ